MAKQVRLIVAGSVVVIVLVQIQSLEKALKKAQKELARVAAQSKDVQETAGRLLAANNLLDAETKIASTQLLRLEEGLAQLRQQQQPLPTQQQPKQLQAAPVQPPSMQQ